MRGIRGHAGKCFGCRDYWIDSMIIGFSLAVRHSSRKPDGFVRPNIHPFLSSRYGDATARLLLIFLIGITYAILAPLILPFSFLFFAVGSYVWTYQVCVGISSPLSSFPPAGTPKANCPELPLSLNCAHY